MPFARPSLADLREQIRTSIRTALGLGPLLNRSAAGAIADALAGAVHSLHGYLEWISKQPFPDTAEAENLDRIGSIYGVTRKAASFASGSLELTGDIGVSVPAGTRWRLPNGEEFELDGLGLVFANTTLTASVVAVRAGTESNAEVDTELTVTSPIAGMQSTATVSSELAGGTDTESDVAYRARLLERLRKPPEGGSANDYVTWAKSVAGVTRAFVTPEYDGPGTVAIHIVDDNGDGTIVPGPSVVSDVQDYIDERRPVTAQPTVLAPTAVSVDFSIGLNPDTPEVREAVEASLEDLIRRQSEPGQTLYLSQIREAISIATGEISHTMTVPAADVTRSFGEISELGTITWL